MQKLGVIIKTHWDDIKQEIVSETIPDYFCKCKTPNAVSGYSICFTCDGQIPESKRTTVEKIVDKVSH